MQGLMSGFENMTFNLNYLMENVVVISHSRLFLEKLKKRMTGLTPQKKLLPNSQFM